ncbi:class II aldolase/adducin family protein, partial [Limnoraphis robusta CCNP1324]|nr:class II aldolase/adducin family protein [Limnoraphis robusta CCNP1324]
MTKKIDEGYIKFNCDWTFKPLQITIPEDLLFYRDKLHELKLIGHFEDLNIGYGNISIKTDDGIIVSGTQTGNIFPINKESFTLVTNYEIAKNNVVCEGP